MAQINFKGKTHVRNHHLSVPHRPLHMDAQKSINDKNGVRLDGNLIIHGDNLHALKTLLPMYSGKVDCIYIDPPYNTGNEGWCYNDNVSSPQMQSWLQGSPITIEDDLRHDKWCAMMWPRLVLLHQLLAENGIIYISIDDNEQHRLRMMMDEIFGDDNFVALLPVVSNLKGNNDQFGFAGCHEYAMVFCKDKEKTAFNEFVIDDEDIDDWSEDDIGLYKIGAGLKSTGQNAPRDKRPHLYFPVYVTPDDVVYVTDKDKPLNEKDVRLLPTTNGMEMTWRWNKTKFRNDSSEIIVNRSNGGISLHKKQRPNGDAPSRRPKSLFYKPSYSSGNGTAMLKDIFNSRVFNNPKPLALIKDLIHLATLKDSVILDSFAGSGTTAHATLSLNKEDGGNRKFILVECEDYANKTTAERVRRVIQGVPSSKDELLKAGLGGTFTYCTLGKSIEAERILQGKELPSYQNLASLLFHTATAETVVQSNIDETSSYIGESKLYHIWLIYKPDADFLRSHESALTLRFAHKIVKSKKGGKRHLVFAPFRYVSDSVLFNAGNGKALPVDYQPLPWSLYRVEK